MRWSVLVSLWVHIVALAAVVPFEPQLGAVLGPHAAVAEREPRPIEVLRIEEAPQPKSPTAALLAPDDRPDPKQPPQRRPTDARAAMAPHLGRSVDMVTTLPPPRDASAPRTPPPKDAKLPPPPKDAPAPPPPRPEDVAATEPPEVDPPSSTAKPAPADAPPPPKAPADPQTSAEADPPPPPPASDVRKFVRLDQREASEAPPESGEYISSVDEAADQSARTLISAREWGSSPAAEDSKGTRQQASQRRVDGGGKAHRTEHVASSRAATVAEEPSRGGGGGWGGQDAGRGSRTIGGHDTEGGAVAPPPVAGVSASAAVAAVAGSDEVHVDGREQAELGQAPMTGPTDDWWHPTAMRIDPTPGEPTPKRSVTAAPRRSPSSRAAPAVQGVAAIDNPGDDRGEGGTDRPNDDAQGPAPGQGDRDRLDPVADDRDALAATDPIDELRDAFGWGKLDRSQLKPRPGSTGSLGTLALAGSDAASQQAVLDDTNPISDHVVVPAVGSPLGTYTEKVYGVLQQRWYDLDLDLDGRAIGIEGRATVVFRVHKNGKVTDVAVEASSGNVDLDRMALQSVPERLPRFPRELDLPWVVQHVTFSYQNPLIPPLSGGTQ